MQQKNKLLNQKYCWIYPKNENELLKIIPNVDHYQTLYTKCDQSLEQYAHEYILKLEDQFKGHYKLVKKEIEIQNNLIDVAWVESQKILFLTQRGVCVKLYPEIISIATEKRALHKFHKSLKQINDSNYSIGISLENIRSSRAELNQICDQLDITIESPFILGNYFLKPLAYTRKILDDLYNYFYMNFCQLKCWAQLLNPTDSVAIEDYTALIKSNNNLIKYLPLNYYIIVNYK